MNFLHNRNVAGALRVMAGRKSVEPNLTQALHARNHQLDDLFETSKLIMKHKKKEEEKSNEETQDDGYSLVEHVGVYNFFKHK